MSGFVDIHAHVLAGIDDGPEDIDGATAMAQAAAEAGTATIAVTPHLRADFPAVRVEELADRCARLREQLDRRDIAVNIVSGAEVSLVWALEASDEQLALASYGQLGTDLLIETPGDVTALEQLLYQVRARGYRVTLAHPERSATFRRDRQRLHALTEQGVLLQLNASALLSAGQRPARGLAVDLCREGRAHVIASDSHRAHEWRPVTALASAVTAAAELVGPARAEWMAGAAPGAIIAGQALPPAPEIEAPARSWWPWSQR